MGVQKCHDCNSALRSRGWSKVVPPPSTTPCILVALGEPMGMPKAPKYNGRCSAVRARQSIRYIQHTKYIKYIQHIKYIGYTKYIQLEASDDFAVQEEGRIWSKTPSMKISTSWGLCPNSLVLYLMHQLGLARIGYMQSWSWGVHGDIDIEKSSLQLPQLFAKHLGRG
jgi:hypothetical protein